MPGLRCTSQRVGVLKMERSDFMPRRPSPCSTSVPLPSGKSRGIHRKPLAHMSPDELAAWIRRTKAHLQQKMQRERAYLDRRAARGICTSTDEVYEHDQLLEADLVAMLDEIQERL